MPDTVAIDDEEDKDDEDNVDDAVTDVVVALTLLDADDVPFEFLAFIVMVYVVLGDKFVIVIGEDDEYETTPVFVVAT